MTDETVPVDALRDIAAKIAPKVRQQVEEARAARADKGVKPDVTVEPPSTGPAKQTKEARTREEPAPTEAAEDVVPKRRLEEVGRHKQKLEADIAAVREENAKLAAQLEELRRGRAVEEVASADRPSGWDDWDPERKSAWIADQVASRHRTDASGVTARIRELEQRLGDLDTRDKLRGLDLTDAQYAATREIYALGGLTPVEAASLAAWRNPDLWPQPREEMPASHQVSKPGARVPEGDKRQGLREKIRNAAATGDRHAALEGIASLVQSARKSR